MAALDLEQLRGLAAKLSEREAADPETYPRANIDDLKAAGIHVGPLAPPQGGAGWTLREAVQVVETIAAGSGSAALLVSMPMGLAGIYGSEIMAPDPHRVDWMTQVEAVTARMRRGEWYAACNSERGAGGSLAATKTEAKRGEDGTFRITGEKILASSGRFADYFFSTAKVPPEQMPGCGVVEFFFTRPGAPGVHVLEDWDGFGMRSTESHSVRFEDAAVEGLMGFPNFLEVARPLQYWFCLFAAIPLGCARAILQGLGTPAPGSPALRARLSDATMRLESLEAYLHETASMWRVGAAPTFAARVLRTKTFVTQEATKLAAELFALSGGRHYSRKSPLSRAFADAFAGTALRPPLGLGLETLVESYEAPAG